MKAKQGVIDGENWRICKPVNAPVLPNHGDDDDDADKQPKFKPTRKLDKITQPKLDKFLAQFNPQKIRFVQVKHVKDHCMEQLQKIFLRDLSSLPPIDGKFRAIFRVFVLAVVYSCHFIVIRAHFQNRTSSAFHSSLQHSWKKWSQRCTMTGGTNCNSWR